MVPADNYITRDIDRLYHTNGKSDTSEIFSNGSVFIEHAIGYMRIKHQLDLNSTENVR